eukprot:10633851-Prorocentrum_lima.AAC.1
MEELVAFVEKRSPEIMKEYRSKLESKVKELLGDTTIDESRIATEVIICLLYTSPSPRDSTSS